MYQAVLPKPSGLEHWLLTGASDHSAADGGREDMIEESEEQFEDGSPQDTDSPMRY